MRVSGALLCGLLLTACSFDSSGANDELDAAGPEADASTGSFDAPATQTDASTLTPDAAPTAPDAQPGTPDASPPPADAMPPPDAAPPPDAMPGPLTDRGLLVRYYIDEAASGQIPTELVDSAPSPLPLALTYTPELSFTAVAANRGLSWSNTGVDSRASVAVDGSKLDTDLEGSQTATIELVVDIEAVTGLTSRISHIGLGAASGKLTLATTTSGQLHFYWRDSLAERWTVPLPTSDRITVHVVVDTTRATDAERVILYVDGVAHTPLDSTPPALNDTVDLGTGHHYVLGNREIGGRSFQGIMYYAAMYNSALTASEVANNAAVLTASDDAP